MHAEWWGPSSITKSSSDDKGCAGVDWTGKTILDNVQGEFIQPS